MRNFIIATVFLLSLIGTVSKGQVKVLGAFIVGDSAQTHLLVQKDSSRFVGRCMGISKDSLSFEYLGQLWKFGAQDIAYLRVANPEDESSKMDSANNEAVAYVQTSDYIYMGKGQEKLVFYGKFISIKDGVLTLEDKDQLKRAYSLHKIKSFWLVGDDISKFEAEPLYLNLLVTKSKQIHKGQITKYDGQNLYFQLLHDSLMTVPMAEIQEIILLNQEATKEKAISDIIDTARVSKQELFNNSVFFTPVAFTNKKNTRFYRNVYAYFNSFSWYVTPNININAYVSPLGAGLSAKFILPLGEFANLGVGSNLFAVYVKGSGYLMPFGILTIGNKKSFLTMSYHALNIKSENDAHPKLRGAFSLAGSISMTPKLSFFADLVFSKSFELIELYDKKVLWTTGISYYAKKSRWDLGGLYIKNAFAEDGYPGQNAIIPAISFTVRNSSVKKK